MRVPALIATLALLCPLSVRAQQTDTLTLIEAVEAALAMHPSYAIRLVERERAAAGADELRATRLPRLTTEWSGVRHQEPMIVRPLHGFDPQNPPEFERSLLNGSLTASWLLFDGGARGARIARAEALTEAAGAGAEAARSTLLLRVARAYLSVLDARELAAAVNAQVVALEAERTRVLRFEAEGRVAHVAVLRAEAALSRARADAAAREARLREAQMELARLTGGAPASALSAVQLETPVLPARADLLARAMDANAEVQRARRQVVAAQAARRESRAAYLPALSLAGRYQAYGSAGGTMTAEWQTGVQLSWPVFTGGQREAAVERTTAEYSIAQHALRLAELDVEALVDRALAAVAEADASATALDAALAQYEAVVRVEQLALVEGAGVQTDFLSAQSELVETRALRSAAHHARTLARVELARATGELSADWLNANLVRSR